MNTNYAFESKKETRPSPSQLSDKHGRAMVLPAEVVRLVQDITPDRPVADVNGLESWEEQQRLLESAFRAQVCTPGADQKQRTELLMTHLINPAAQDPLTGSTVLHLTAKRNNHELYLFLRERMCEAAFVCDHAGKIPAEYWDQSELKRAMWHSVGQAGVTKFSLSGYVQSDLLSIKWKKSHDVAFERRVKRGGARPGFFPLVERPVAPIDVAELSRELVNHNGSYISHEDGSCCIM